MEEPERWQVTKHGIDFETAARVFDDPNAIMRHDRDIDGEQLWQTIGSFDGGFPVLLVVHTMTDQDGDSLVRIISARKATRKERRLYEEGDYLN